MMKKKGMTLVEVIISVGLISVVMIFLFNLLLDIQYQSNHSSYLKENQRNRALIIKRVEEDLMNNPLTSVSLQKNSNYAIIYFNYASGISSLTVYRDRITYRNIDSLEETWMLEKGGNEDAYYDIAAIPNPERSGSNCSYILNIDTNNDGTCDINCDTNHDGILNSSDSTTINEEYQTCTSYQYIHITIPTNNGENANTIDDIDIFYIGAI